MDALAQPKSGDLRRLYWRDEILQLLFWIEGEGLGSEADLELIDRFLGPEGEIAVLHLDRLVQEGYLERSIGPAYRLSAVGRHEGARLFAEEYGRLAGPDHGPCGTECWCRRLAAEAQACQAARLAGRA